ncbi:DUF1572 domain-containing protein [Flavobacterium branchiophilum NBRC 15030 = ATCC 35035]|uniref:Uncharacterized protein DUF1572 n=1 Tax=Flavobacterium branchiophilum TaxID=55197 RepID=A0A543G893_9FLAO|nr:DUF1572 family protein [Flavobacterium branchiophilum]OXA81921.1 DUF1572 domain-containing protein [Flavobacterium branchiophilum NBRC 15030 = ATCC 35035]TQM42300.1 uncharacterized protein DUF1572 [Flavobacterium branchiophilum]GEM54727.1 hypothetical protein FB1_09480 [Flavobacterium branchiophilum NBRC 15030 = ATCC 35035]
MKLSTYLSDRLRAVYLDGHWIANTNFKSQLEHTNWQQATQKLDNFNTIAALIFHINYYLEGLLNAFDSGKIEISDAFSFDCPPIQSDADWNNMIRIFLDHAEKFSVLVENLDESVFEQPFFDDQYGSMIRNIEGVIEHSYYHLGQIVLINKLLQKNNK